MSSKKTKRKKWRARIYEAYTRIPEIAKKVGYNNNAIGNLWKWYDYSERKGVASY